MNNRRTGAVRPIRPSQLQRPNRRCSRNRPSRRAWPCLGTIPTERQALKNETTQTRADFEVRSGVLRQEGTQEQR